MKLITMPVLVIASLLATAGDAKPDVFFADSANYQDAYLVHEFSGNNIKFKMTNDAANIALPAQGYDFDALVAYTNHVYQFANPGLRSEFVKMFNQSFESASNTVPFLTELVRLLQHFAAAHPDHVH